MTVLLIFRRLRAMHDAIVVGIGTVLADNPSLTTRLVPGPSPHPVVLDSRLKCPPTQAIIKARGKETLGAILMCSATMDDEMLSRKLALERAGAVVCPYDISTGLFGALRCVRAKFQHCTFMIEGGASVITSALQAPKLDRVIITMSPLIVGGLPSINRPVDLKPVRLKYLHVVPCGGDLLLDCQVETNQS